MRTRRIALVAGAGLLLALAVQQHPSAEIRILTHDVADLSPRRMEAAVDLGVTGVSVLVTWTAQRIVR